jgi:hypothetical protein
MLVYTGSVVIYATTPEPGENSPFNDLNELVINE